MDGNFIAVTSNDVNLNNQSLDEASAVSGLHTMKPEAEFTLPGDAIIGEIHEDCNRDMISGDGSSAVSEKDGEITLNSAFIPENAVLMETSRGLMLTVPEINGLTFGEETTSNETPRQLLSCIPVLAVDDAGAVFGAHVAIKTNSRNMQEDNSAVEIQVKADASKKCVKNQTAPLAESNPSHGAVNGGGATVKKKSGWPKGKKRKIQPEVTGPRPPMTGYVLYTLDRRKEIKESHPEIPFQEVTKILGQEWSTMAPDVKSKYLAAAEDDKKRYKDELKAFRSSETYQENMRKRLMEANSGGGSSHFSSDSNDILSCDEGTESELHCKVCNIYFSNLHNKREHMYGKAHIQNVAGEVEKGLLSQQQESRTFIGSALEVSEDLSDDGFSSSSLRGGGTSPEGGGGSVAAFAGPVDIQSFMVDFYRKNYEREQEISILKKCLSKALQENVAICKEIQALQEHLKKLEDELKMLSSSTSSLIVQSNALKMVPTMFSMINI